jgi:hypothetical protein
MPRTLFAQTDAPTPLPQIANPPFHLLSSYCLCKREDVVGIIITLTQVVCSEIDNVMSGSLELFD